jgi:hypothetical protein
VSGDNGPLRLRTWTLAYMLLQQTQLVRRYASVALTEELKQRLQRLLGYKFALEGFARMERLVERRT